MTNCFQSTNCVNLHQKQETRFKEKNLNLKTYQGLEIIIRRIIYVHIRRYEDFNILKCNYPSRLNPEAKQKKYIEELTEIIK